MKSLEDRLAALERANRRYRLLLSVFAVTAVAAICLGADTGAGHEDGLVYNIIKARQFQVVNKDGTVVAGMAFNSDGNGFAYVNAKSGKRIAQVFFNSNGGAVQVKNDADMIVAGLGSDKDGGVAYGSRRIASVNWE